jgi:hypothetical protein
MLAISVFLSPPYVSLLFLCRCNLFRTVIEIVTKSNHFLVFNHVSILQQKWNEDSHESTCSVINNNFSLDMWDNPICVIYA